MRDGITSPQGRLFCSACLAFAACVTIGTLNPVYGQDRPPAAGTASASAASANAASTNNATNTSSAAGKEPLPPPSAAAQKLYDAAKDDLLQIRTLVRNGRTQSSVGSGFLIGRSDLVITNYHVVSQIALEPDTYVGEFVDTHGQRGNVELQAVDVLHDIAVVRVTRKGTGYFDVEHMVDSLNQGQYLYSLGNPLDLGFTISEGTYNGVIGRSLYDQLMFTGPINAGMSGGPSMTANGRLAGINVAKRLDGELVSFLVPIRYAGALLERVRQQKQAPKDFKKEIAAQLLQHQSAMVDKVLNGPLDVRRLGPYQIGVRESAQMRCWGQSTNKPELPYGLDRIDCNMESPLFISDNLQTAAVSMRHEFSRSKGMGALRFSQFASAAFKNENFGNARDLNRTRPECQEQFVNNGKQSLRALLCVRGYYKFPDLYDFALLTASTDDALMSLQSRIDAVGVSYDNGLRITKTFIHAISKIPEHDLAANHDSAGSDEKKDQHGKPGSAQ